MLVGNVSVQYAQVYSPIREDTPYKGFACDSSMNTKDRCDSYFPIHEPQTP
ncbi:MAG: hypothetical protein [Olavius algarvensis Gamma 1 endosymbiont]|nr:MAG: hypothetical protein [Olavius algarvensis Gamma 1 endosymbiont]